MSERNGKPAYQAKIFDEQGIGWYRIDGVWCRGVTSVLGKAYPKDDRLLNWIANSGSGGEAYRDDAAMRGTNVHRAVRDLLGGATLSADAFPKDEWKCLVSFGNWMEDVKPTIEAVEQTVYDTRYRLA